jgi:TPR repeat protein
MALAVTPHILEEGNYVREKEYRAARERGKDVLPVEAVHADDKEVEGAFPGIRPRVDMHNRPALEELLKKAGFKGPGSRSAFAEYLLGMAFFIPVSVEKDVERAVRLFKTSADHDCAEAC